MRGQTKYNGVGTEPVITEHIIELPEMPRTGTRLGHLVDYWTLPVNKVATVSNPFSRTITVRVDCVASFPNVFDNVDIPAHTSQDMLLTTNAQHMYQTLCQIEEMK